MMPVKAVSHPAKTYPEREGLAGGVAAAPKATVCVSRTVPFQSTNVTVWLSVAAKMRTRFLQEVEKVLELL